MYFIFPHESINHFSIPASSIVCLWVAHVSGSLLALPLRTNSIILKAFIGLTPWYIKYTIISSRHPITWEKGTTLFLINSCALPNQTSVPCDKPDILINSAKVLGLVSSTIPIVNGVPNSGIPSVPVLHIICSLVTPNALVDVNILIVSLSSNGTFNISVPVKSCIIRNWVGSEWPNISSFNKSASIEW